MEKQINERKLKILQAFLVTDNVINAINVLERVGRGSDSPFNFASLVQPLAVLKHLMDEATEYGLEKNGYPFDLNSANTDYKKLEEIIFKMKMMITAIRSAISEHWDKAAANQESALLAIMTGNFADFYYGIDVPVKKNKLENHPLKKEMKNLQFQDNPFTELVEYDPSIWDMHKHCPELVSLILFAADITDDILDLLDIDKISNLKELDLAENHISKLPESFNNLPQLEILNLRSNQITHLPENLAGLKGLKYLNIRSNHLNDTEIARIQSALPDTHICI